MSASITIRLRPEEAADDNSIKKYCARQLRIQPHEITGFHILRKSIDARGRQVWLSLTIQLYIQETFSKRDLQIPAWQSVQKAHHRVIIAGAGPAGLFAALQLIEAGIQPIILERGKDVRARRRDLARLNKEGVVDPDSNYCFGEGGAGTYSDGKLYTRSTKRGNVTRILHILHHFGADERILYEAHPHIGTNKLPAIITAMRQQIIDAGGLFLFNKKLTGLIIEDGTVKGAETADGDRLMADALVLATGHSARDIFEQLHRQQVLVAFKPFALGVRIEHPQALIDQIQYHQPIRNELLPPASYSLVQQVEQRGVFSFCMCPGGIIAPAATSPGELVVNGWSPSRRNNPYANSGMVAGVEEKDIPDFHTHGPLAGMYFQQSVEQKAFEYGGGQLVAPALRMTDFVEQKLSATLPDCSYLPGIRPAPLHEVLPPFIYQSLQQAFVEFGKKMRGYYTREAVVVATESRTSSPVRIPRDTETLEHPQIKGLYPCAEGAGYAGGIVSAAMDGERVAVQIAAVLTGNR